MVDPQLGFDVEDLKRQAVGNRRRWKHPNPEFQGEEDAQEAVKRYWEAGGLSAVTPALGTARALVGGFLTHVQKESTRSRNHRGEPLPDDIEDPNPVRADMLLGEAATTPYSDRAHRVLHVWWAGLTSRRRLAVVKIRGPIFGLRDDAPIEPSDRTAYFHAMRQLRELAAECKRYE